jgi:hypothetical protein
MTDNCVYTLSGTSCISTLKGSYSWWGGVEYTGTTFAETTLLLKDLKVDFKGGLPFSVLNIGVSQIDDLTNREELSVPIPDITFVAV